MVTHIGKILIVILIVGFHFSYSEEDESTEVALPKESIDEVQIINHRHVILIHPLALLLIGESVMFLEIQR